MESADIALGTKRVIDGRARVYYYGYWVRAYDAPVDSLQAKKLLIEALTRRLFNHVENGINVPGRRLDDTRRAYESEHDPERKRVKGAMLAGAIFNRAADIFRKVVEMQELGVVIEADNTLMAECGAYLEEALELSKLVLHRSGEEGLDELWGEPFKAFSFPIEAFYASRYVKIAKAMAAIDGIGKALGETIGEVAGFASIAPAVVAFVVAAKNKCETLCTDDDIFDVWTSMVVFGERLARFEPELPAGAPPSAHDDAARGMALVREAKDVIFHITRARVPMPKTAANLVERCHAYRASAGVRSYATDPDSERKTMSARVIT